MTSPEVAETVVRDGLEARVRRVWMHRGAGRGAPSQSPVEYCRKRDIAVIPGECPMMLVGRPAWYHRLHALGKKLAGSYPH